MRQRGATVIGDGVVGVGGYCGMRQRGATVIGDGVVGVGGCCVVRQRGATVIGDGVVGVGGCCGVRQRGATVMVLVLVDVVLCDREELVLLVMVLVLLKTELYDWMSKLEHPGWKRTSA